MYDAGQTATGKLEKPSITNITVSRGVIEYVVAEGETMESIAAKYGISTDQIRWSNLWVRKWKPRYRDFSVKTRIGRISRNESKRVQMDCELRGFDLNCVYRTRG